MSSLLPDALISEEMNPVAIGSNQTVTVPEVVVKRVVGRVGEVKAVTVTGWRKPGVVGNALKLPEAVATSAMLLRRVRVKREWSAPESPPSPLKLISPKGDIVAAEAKDADATSTAPRIARFLKFFMGALES